MNKKNDPKQNAVDTFQLFGMCDKQHVKVKGQNQYSVNVCHSSISVQSQKKNTFLP